MKDTLPDPQKQERFLQWQSQKDEPPLQGWTVTRVDGLARFFYSTAKMNHPRQKLV